MKDIKYIVMEQDVELVPPNKVTRTAFKNDCVGCRCISILLVTLSLLVVSSLVLIYGFYSLSEHDELLQVPTGCVPLEPVGRVFVEVVRGHHHVCQDTLTCAALLQKIEELHNGSRYNFVIGSGMELYIGQGFRCRVNPPQNDLHIKVLWTNDTLEGEIHRLTNIIDEGLKCDHILPNFTVTYSCDETEIQCANAVEYLNGTVNASQTLDQMPVIGHTIHSPASETGMILHKALRWTPCGQASHHARNITKTKVLTLKGLPRQRCLPFSSPVDQIHVYYVEDQTNLTCRDQSCDNVIGFLESLYEGFYYNFVISASGDLYIGLGFRCQGNHSNTGSLNIMVLAKDDLNLDHGVLRIAELVKQGLECGKVSHNYTVSPYFFVDGSFKPNFPFLSIIQRFLNDTNFADEFNDHYWGATDFNYHNMTEARYVPWNYKFVACAKDHLPAITDTEANITIVTSIREDTTEEGQGSTTASQTSNRDGRTETTTEVVQGSSIAFQTSISDDGTETTTESITDLTTDVEPNPIDDPDSTGSDYHATYEMD